MAPPQRRGPQRRRALGRFVRGLVSVVFLVGFAYLIHTPLMQFYWGATARLRGQTGSLGATRLFGGSASPTITGWLAAQRRQTGTSPAPPGPPADAAALALSAPPAASPLTPRRQPADPAVAFVHTLAALGSSASISQAPSRELCSVRCGQKPTVARSCLCVVSRRRGAHQNRAPGGGQQQRWASCGRFPRQPHRQRPAAHVRRAAGACSPLTAAAAAAAAACCCLLLAKRSGTSVSEKQRCARSADLGGQGVHVAQHSPVAAAASGFKQ